jgi:kinesin family protein 3/17
MIEGGRTAKQSAQEQEVKLKVAEQQVMEAKQRQAALKIEKEKAEEAKLLLEENYSNIKEEVNAKTKKIELLTKKLQFSETELKDLQTEFEQDREGYLSTFMLQFIFKRHMYISECMN